MQISLSKVKLYTLTFELLLFAAVLTANFMCAMQAWRSARYETIYILILVSPMRVPHFCGIKRKVYTYFSVIFCKKNFFTLLHNNIYCVYKIIIEHKLMLLKYTLYINDASKDRVHNYYVFRPFDYSFRFIWGCVFLKFLLFLLAMLFI